MLYREVGQFKTSYAADQAIFPIAQDRWFVLFVVAFAFLAVPLFANQYLYTEVLMEDVERMKHEGPDARPGRYMEQAAYDAVLAREQVVNARLK